MHGEDGQHWPQLPRQAGREAGRGTGRQSGAPASPLPHSQHSQKCNGDRGRHHRHRESQEAPRHEALLAPRQGGHNPPRGGWDPDFKGTARTLGTVAVGLALSTANVA